MTNDCKKMKRALIVTALARFTKSFLTNDIKPRVAQVVIGHHRVVAGFLNAKYRHLITSFRRSGKVFVFEEKTASMPPRCPRGENLWASAVQLIAGEKSEIFDLFPFHFCNMY